MDPQSWILEYLDMLLISEPVIRFIVNEEIKGRINCMKKIFELNSFVHITFHHFNEINSLNLVKFECAIDIEKVTVKYQAFYR